MATTKFNYGYTDPRGLFGLALVKSPGSPIVYDYREIYIIDRQEDIKPEVAATDILAEIEEIYEKLK